MEFAQLVGFTATMFDGIRLRAIRWCRAGKAQAASERLP